MVSDRKIQLGTIFNSAMMVNPNPLPARVGGEDVHRLITAFVGVTGNHFLERRVGK